MRGSTGSSRTEPWALLQRAQGSLQKWPEGFPGFRARLRFRTQCCEGGGSVECAPGGHAVVEVSEPAVRAAALDWLAEVARERTPHFFKDGDGRYPVSLEEAAGPPLVCRVRVHQPDGDQVAYGLDAKGRIRRIERDAGPLRIVTTVEEYVRATPGRVLPARAVCVQWDSRRDGPPRTEVMEDGHVRIDHVWLPSSRRIVREDAASAISLTIDDHRPL